MRTFASLFSGGGGADIGAIAAGLKPIWGVELKPEIAEWYAVNIGHPAIVGDVCGVDFSKLESPFWLHMSPECKRASSSNGGATESQEDLNAAAACVRAIETLRPEYVSLENVRAYATYKAFVSVVCALHEAGYKAVWRTLNAADYGVPQTRERLVLIASRSHKPSLPIATHHRVDTRLQPPLFQDSVLLPWFGWLPAITDLVDGLEPTEITPSQRRRLHRSKNKNGLLQVGQTSSNGFQLRPYNRPAFTVMTGQPPRAIIEGKAVQLDVSCVARFQAFPDGYRLPNSQHLALTVIGNAVPPLLMQRVIEANL